MLLSFSYGDVHAKMYCLDIVVDIVLLSVQGTEMKQKDGKDRKDEKDDQKGSQSPSDLPLQAYIISQERRDLPNGREGLNEVCLQGLPHIKTVNDFRDIHIN